MMKIGQNNQLRVVKEVPFGFYLDGDVWGEVLLPKKVAPQHLKINDQIDVFIYFDSEDKIIATTMKPRAKVGTFAYLKVIDVNRVGAFLDWGLDKDLLVPRPEQHRPLEKDKSYIVYVTQDEGERIVATSKIDYHLDKLPSTYKPGEEVNLMIADTTPLGTKVIINDSHWGLIHAADIFQNLRYGERTKGFIKTVRSDGKLDVVLRKIGQDSIYDLAERILSALKTSGGFLPLHDKSSPFEIQRAFNESKKSFKSAIGQLYKQNKIIIEEKGIRLVQSASNQ